VLFASPRKEVLQEGTERGQTKGDQAYGRFSRAVSRTMLPVEIIDGYLPVRDHGLIGDGATAALVGRDGGISWTCVRRFDSPPLFCSILDPDRGAIHRRT
jgi:hypothetical protein